MQRENHQWLIYHILERWEQLRMPTQLCHPEQKPKMFLMKKATFSIYFFSVWLKFPSCSRLPDQPGFVLLEQTHDEGQWHQLPGEDNQKFSNISMTPMVRHGHVTAWPPSPGRMRQGKKLLNSSGCFSVVELQMFWGQGQAASKIIYIL